MLWIDLLDQRLEFQLSQDPDSLLDLWQKDKKKWIVIDEVQKIPRLMDVVHRGIETKKIKFALTGSSSRKLKRGAANLLGGRADTFFLSPFSSVELGADFELSQALTTGLLPRFWSEKLSEDSKVRSLYSYVQTYLKEEVAAEQLVRNLDPFRRFLISAAQSNAKIINHSKLERDAGIGVTQAERHFEILCDTLLGRYLEPFHSSIRKRQTKRSMFYFFDTGVVRALTNLAGESLSPATYEFGDLFETFLINEFFKISEALEKRWQFSYLCTQDNWEIDLIIEKPRGKPILVEIKSTDNLLKSEDLSQFKKLSENFPASPKYLLSRCQKGYETDGIRALPWDEGLKEIFEL